MLSISRQFLTVMSYRFEGLVAFGAIVATIAAAPMAGAGSGPSGTWFDWSYASWPPHRAETVNPDKESGAGVFDEFNDNFIPGEYAGFVYVGPEDQVGRVTVRTRGYENPDYVYQTTTFVGSPKLGLTAVTAPSYTPMLSADLPGDREEAANPLSRAMFGNYIYGNLPGTWMDSLTGRQTLKLEVPADLAARVASSGSVSWSTVYGEMTYEDTIDDSGVRQIRIHLLAGPGDLSPSNLTELPQLEVHEGKRIELTSIEVEYAITDWVEVSGQDVPAAGHLRRRYSYSDGSFYAMHTQTRRSEVVAVSVADIEREGYRLMDEIALDSRVQVRGEPTLSYVWNGREPALVTDSRAIVDAGLAGQLKPESIAQGGSSSLVTVSLGIFGVIALVGVLVFAQRGRPA